jgi:hypothetical protein
MKIKEFKKIIKQNQSDFQLCFNSLKELPSSKSNFKVLGSEFYKTQNKKVIPAFKNIFRLY